MSTTRSRGPWRLSSPRSVDPPSGVVGMRPDRRGTARGGCRVRVRVAPVRVVKRATALVVMAAIPTVAVVETYVLLQGLAYLLGRFVP